MKPTIPSLAALRFPLAFDVDRLDADLEIALNSNWQSHFNQNDYSGDWKIVSLRSDDGREDNIGAKDVSHYRDTPLMELCSYFKEIVDGFHCEKQAVRLMRLAAGSHIKEHCDKGLGYGDGFFRIHIPIRTHELVSFVVDGHRLPMKAGECWYANFDLPHSVKNEGDEPRIHLVIDCLRNDWSNEFFTQNGFDLKAADHKAPRTEDLPQVIAQLHQMGTETALSIANELKKQMQADVRAAHR